MTLLPEDEWPVQRVMKVFGVTRRLAEKARKEKKENGILPIINSKKGSRHLDEKTEKLASQFFEDDEISRMTPGMKDFVSIKTRDGIEKKQKRLLLFNLKEIYEMFKQKYPDTRISLSSFCLLRPKWCVTADASGMHNTCVCVYHENVNLMIMALPDNKDISDQILMNKMMCESSTDLCHEIQCGKCPGSQSLKTYLKNLFDHNDFEEKDDIYFREWVCTDKTDLRSVYLPVDEFVELLVKRCEQLIPHNYIAKAQSKFLKKLKETITLEECVVVLDFAQNYSFVVQNEVQGFHWTNKQCTVHPICIYYRDMKNGLQCHSMCVISDCKEHDSFTVYAFLHEVMPDIKSRYPQLKLIHYFSDGASGQYKNKNNLTNLCHHESDFGIRAQWHFFGTSHGKGPCDGVGGTLKRLAARASLQRLAEPILTSTELYQWCSLHLSGIQVIHITKEKVKEIADKIRDRTKGVTTVKGTRTFHSFIPLTTSTIKCAKKSESTEWVIKKLFPHPVEEPARSGQGRGGKKTRGAQNRPTPPPQKKRKK